MEEELPTASLRFGLVLQLLGLLGVQVYTPVSGDDLSRLNGLSGKEAISNLRGNVLGCDQILPLPTSGGEEPHKSDGILNPPSDVVLIETVI